MDLNLEEFECLRGRSVALVGGAAGRDTEPVLSGYDIVVRINNHWLRTAGRMEVLYHTRALHKRIVPYLPTDLKLVICQTSDPYPTAPESDLERWCKTHKVPVLQHQRTPVSSPYIYSIEEPPFYSITKPLYRKDLEDLHGRYNPFAGTIAWYIINKLGNTKALHCYGFDFYRNHPSWPKVGGHNAEVDMILMEEAEFR